MNAFGTIQVIQAMLPPLPWSPSPRIVNLSSGLGSLTLATMPSTPYQAKPMLGYNPAKVALNSLPIQFANALAATRVKVEVADPGYVRTDMTGTTAPARPLRAPGGHRPGTPPDDRPRGGFLDERRSVPW